MQVNKSSSSQIKRWAGNFGKEYSDRNLLTLEELDELYNQKYGKTKTELNTLFLGDFDKSMRILEVGANVGNQLLSLQKMGFKDLHGIEINEYAIGRSKARTKKINIIHGSAFDIPFKDDYFDMAFTSGVLIHISPSDIHKALNEIHRCSKEYIWGFEYYADEYTEVTYRDNKDLLWKTDFARLYLDSFDDLELVKEEKIKYLEDENVDTMFLLKKRKV
ncbi:MAG: methyltransferase domain-containing protein [Planctomycetes bacterium]|nr:methyltransferase domain-containing protein [Planctomycetota bacterium]